MIDSIMYCIVFSNKKIDEINIYIGENICSSLYLAAYYSPKKHLVLDSNEGLFWSAVTNSYGLLRDSMPSLKRLLEIFEYYDLLQDDVAQDMLDRCAAIYALRSVYCHNTNPEIFGNARENLRKVYDFFSDTLEIDLRDYADNDFFTIPNFSQYQWKCCFNEICDIVETFIDMIFGAVKKISGTEKVEIVAKWEKLIASWLATGRKYMFDTIKSELAGRFVFISRGVSPSSNHVHEEINKLVGAVVLKEGLKDEADCLTAAYARIISSMSFSAYPYDVIKELYDTYC
jgi:hypothetical protein